MRLLRRLWFAITHRQRQDDLADEMALHRQMMADELRGRGLAEADIAAAAQRAMGNELLARERSQDVWIAPWFQDVAQDVRLAVRMIGRERRFAAAAMVTLGLGIAVSGAAFSFVNAAVFRDLPFESPDRLIAIRMQDPRGFYAGVSYPEFQEWLRHTTVFEQLNAELMQSTNIGDDERAPERLSGTYLTATTFRMLGVAPVIGRDFVGDDNLDGAPAVIILGHGVWHSRYGGDPSVIGRVVRVNGQPTTVIGVMPAGFTYPLVADVWMPMAMAPGLRNMPWTGRGFYVAGRIRAGVSADVARAEVEAIAANTIREHPEIGKDRRLIVMGLKDATLGLGARPLMWALLGAAAVVLLVASANVANLLLARAWSRSREIAVRMAVGAGRWRIIRQTVIECIAIGAGGAAVGAYLSFVAFQWMASAFNVLEFGAPDRPRKPFWFDPTVDGSGWLVIAAAFLFASLGAALLPALHLSRTDPHDLLKDGRDSQGTRVSRRWASVLMVGQIAVALMLLAAGGLFVRNFVTLYQTDPVIATDSLIGMRMTLTQNYGSTESRHEFLRRLDERLVNNAEFAESTIASDLPIFAFTALSRFVALEGEVPDPRSEPRRATYIAAGSRFFDTLKFPVVRGRLLTPEDALRGREGAVVNERFASLFFGGVEALGQRIQLSQPGPAPEPPPAWLTIVGIVPTMPDYLPNRPDDAVVYAPLAGDPTVSRAFAVIVRARSKASAAAALREEVTRLDSDLPVYAIQTFDEILAMTRMGARTVGSWFQALATIALVLAAVGLYALTAHGVAQRRREIGVRMTLGARADQVLWMFVRQTLRLVAVGLVIGAVAGLSTTRLLAAFVGDINPRDPVAFGVGAVLLTTVALLASLAPARRATRIDPALTLRGD
jgi:putative ABC transport system permease protein